MNFSELIIVYLALGAPFAVHNYLSSASVHRGRRMAHSIFTLVFWIPSAIRLVRRYLRYAYSKGDFVSGNFLDAEKERIAALSEAVVAEVLPTVVDLNIHDLREIVSRYVGLNRLSGLAGVTAENSDYDLFRAAVTRNPKLATICLARKQERHLRRHLDQARSSLLSLYTAASTGGVHTTAALELARELQDAIAVRSLSELGTEVEEISKLQVTSSAPAYLRPLSSSRHINAGEPSA